MSLMGFRNLPAWCAGLGLFLSASMGAASEPQPYRIDTWRVEDGLPQSSVTSIVQSRDGYLWLGTFNGLVRFDGVQFKVFGPNNTPGLPSSRIVKLYADRAGTLWVSTEEGSLVRYARGEFKTYVLPNSGQAPAYIMSFAETPDGTLWMATSQGQLLWFARGQPEPVPAPWQPPGRALGGLAASAQGGLWVSTEKVIAAWRPEGMQPVFRAGELETFDPGVLAGSRRGGCWVARSGRLKRFDRGDWVEDFGAYPWSKGGPYCTLEDREGQLWIGTYGSGLFRYSTNGSMLHLSSQEGLPGNLIRSAFQDHEGNLWVGTEGEGLARLKPAVFQSFGRQQGLSGDCVLSVCEGEDGELWIGTNGDGVNRLQDGAVRHFGPEQGLSNECVWSVLQDRNKCVWSGTWGGGLFRLQGERFVSVTDAAASSPVVCALYEDRAGTLWVGQQRPGLELGQGRGGKLSLFGFKHQLPRVDIRAVTEDDAGNLWVGSHGDGLYRVNKEGEAHFGKPEGLSSEFIRSLYADKAGVLWIGTYGGGLNRLAAGRVSVFTTRQGLVNDSLCYITEDGRGNLWCGSLGGVFRVSKVELNQLAAGESGRLHCWSYTTVDGLPSLECSGGSQPSGWKTRDGRLWFPTVRGLAVVDPEQLPVNPIPPPVVIEEVLMEGHGRSSVFIVPAAADSDQQAAGLQEAASRLEVPPGDPRLEIHYTGLSLTAPRKVRFQYRLDGLEKEWVEAGTRRTANYSYLPPGDYRFWVRACNNDGIWNERGAALAITILPHFWQTWWFRLLVAAGAVILFVGLYEIRLASARKLTRLRLRIARDLHDEVGSNLGSIALLSEVMPRHLEGPAGEVAEIRRLALQTIGSLRDIVWFLDPACDSMEDLVLRMRETAKTMLPGVACVFSSSGEAEAARPSLALRRNVFPMFKEILHNIGKHARATRVEILIRISATEFQLRVTDNGTGFDEVQVKPGNGLKNLRRRAAELKGTLEIQSRPGEGAVVSLQAPIT